MVTPGSEDGDDRDQQSNGSGHHPEDDKHWVPALSLGRGSAYRFPSTLAGSLWGPIPRLTVTRME
jgi:hypothetical protein